MPLVMRKAFHWRPALYQRHGGPSLPRDGVVIGGRQNDNVAIRPASIAGFTAFKPATPHRDLQQAAEAGLQGANLVISPRGSRPPSSA